MLEAILVFGLVWNVGFTPVVKNLSMERETYCKEVLMKLPPHYKADYVEICKGENND